MKYPNPFRYTNRTIIAYVGLSLRLGLTMALCILLGFGGALLLEQKFHSGGMLLVAGIVLGVLAGGVAAYRMTMKELLPPDDDESDTEK